MIGLGRMGASTGRCLRRAGHQCVVYDLHAEAVGALLKEGAIGTTLLPVFADKLLPALRYEFGGHMEKSAAKKGGTR